MSNPPSLDEAHIAARVLRWMYEMADVGSEQAYIVGRVLTIVEILELEQTVSDE